MQSPVKSEAAPSAKHQSSKSAMKRVQPKSEHLARQAPDLKARIRLLQSRLHPNSCQQQQQQDEERDDQDSASVTSLGSLASCSSSSSSDSSEAPTPPPRLSSLQQYSSDVSASQSLGSFSSAALAAPKPVSGRPGEAHASKPAQARPAHLQAAAQFPTPVSGATSGAQQAHLLSAELATSHASRQLKPPTSDAHLHLGRDQQRAYHKHSHHANQSIQRRQCLASQSAPASGQPSVLQVGGTKSATLVHNYLPQSGRPVAPSASASHQLSLQQALLPGQRGPSGQQAACLGAGATTRPPPLPLLRPLPEFSFADSTRAPITKAVQNMVSQRQHQHQHQQQQQLATIVINRPSSRQPIHGCASGQQQAALLGLPLLHLATNQLAARLGSTCSASMTSISSVSTHSSSASQQTALGSPTCQAAPVNPISSQQESSHDDQVSRRHLPVARAAG